MGFMNRARTERTVSPFDRLMAPRAEPMGERPRRSEPERQVRRRPR